MVDQLTYRTDDGTRWGTGQDSDLDAAQVDVNFYTLWAAMTAIEDHQEHVAQIASLHAIGNQLFVTLTDNSVIGPITIPTSQWRFRKDGWLPLTAYAAFDVFNRNGATYLVLIAHTSAATFSPTATDGATHDLYGLLLEAPENMLPENGTFGQRLMKSAGSPFNTEWINDKIRLVSFTAGQPAPNQLVLQFACVDDCFFPAGLVGSVAFCASDVAADNSWIISKNFAPIGSIDFTGPSPQGVGVTFSSQIDCIPGDVITVNAPNPVDATQSDITIVLVALLTG